MKSVLDYLYFRFYMYMLKVPNRYNAAEGGVLLLAITSMFISFLIYFIIRPFILEALKTHQLLGSSFMIIIPVGIYIIGYKRYIKDNKYKNIIKKLSVNYKEKSMFLDILFVFSFILVPTILIFVLAKIFSIYRH